MHKFLPRAVTLQDCAERRVPDDKVEVIKAAGLLYLDRIGKVKPAKPQCPAAPPPSYLLGESAQHVTKIEAPHEEHNDGLSMATQSAMRHESFSTFTPWGGCPHHSGSLDHSYTFRQ